jgi:hypothetical protein
MILEKTLERLLCERVEAAGGVAEKTTVLGARGFFDRLVVLPGGRVCFVECKKPRGGTISPHQKLRHAVYRQLGAEVVIVKTEADIDKLLQ